MADDIDIRPVSVDKLVEFSVSELTLRKERIDARLAQYASSIEDMRDKLGVAERVHEFLNREHVIVILAQRLKAGDVVRVVCGTCKGTGMKPTNVLSGRIAQSGTAFESVTQRPSNVIDPAMRCVVCEGQRWVLMDRFKG